MTTEPGPCPVCEARADVSHPKHGDLLTVSCWDCGCFEMSISAAATLKGVSLEARRARLSEAKGHATSGEVPKVNV
jgi:hypothetical protein